MIDLGRERADLAKAEADIVAGQQRLTRQEAMVAQLRHDRHDTTRALELLGTLGAMLKEWRSHRATLLQIIEKAERRRES